MQPIRLQTMRGKKLPWIHKYRRLLRHLRNFLHCETEKEEKKKKREKKKRKKIFTFVRGIQSIHKTSDRGEKPPLLLQLRMVDHIYQGYSSIGVHYQFSFLGLIFFFLSSFRPLSIRSRPFLTMRGQTEKAPLVGAQRNIIIATLVPNICSL